MHSFQGQIAVDSQDFQRQPVLERHSLLRWIFSTGSKIGNEKGKMKGAAPERHLLQLLLATTSDSGLSLTLSIKYLNDPHIGYQVNHNR